MKKLTLIPALLLLIGCSKETQGDFTFEDVNECESIFNLNESGGGYKAWTKLTNKFECLGNGLYTVCYSFKKDANGKCIEANYYLRDEGKDIEVTPEIQEELGKSSSPNTSKN